MMAAPLDLAKVTAQTFAPYVGQAFQLSEGGELTLHQAEVSRYAKDGAQRPFVLVFESAVELNLAQQAHELSHASLGVAEIFLVPMAPVAGRSRYEAVFN